ncbi:hydroxyacid dehydrogenase [Microbacterium sp. ARD32]|uniref:hydroxyacid dehydrogenase n=1 Tax=Microbacterium sp. ARD32 TaxID=2962577 RepID=UPI0028829BB4|nr:hydroxyacid dehydrogenase [Microbacterium sp. ARD32]MDT0158222.1 hydroxyacid dehydrogenase [Microbacterium sp. ARD32]
MPSSRPRAHAAMSTEAFELLFDDSRRRRFAELADVRTPMHLPDLTAPGLDELLADVEVLITSWGAPRFDAALLDRMPRLRAVLHAAGSIRHHVSEEFWERGIRITTAADANAVPVAEFTLAMILLAGKRVLPHVRAPRIGAADWNDNLLELSIGNLDRTVGLVGFSRIGRRVAELLRPFAGLRVLVADPFADPGEVAALGAELVPLERMLPQANVLSLHAPALPSTHRMISVRELAALPDAATVINTARGSLLDHDALADECRTGRIDAVLDVTDPEPLPADSPLFRLPNVTITPHRAGSLGTETRRLADSALDELAAYASGAPLLHPMDAVSLVRSA